MKVKIYVEGGGDSRSLHIKCREGFRKLFERAGFKGRMPATRACGGRAAAYDDFKIAVEHACDDEYPMLLVDSEAAVTSRPWQHLQTRDGWNKPASADDDQAHLMVQCMETWLLADRGAVRLFFGADLQESALPPVNDLESREKDDIQDALTHATMNCGRDREYKKGKRSFELLGRLDPDELMGLPHFARLRKVLDAKL